MVSEKYKAILDEITQHKAKLVAVSKTKPTADVLALYHAGQRLFGENKVQEMLAKYEALPKDIRWHMIGHLQTNKVKLIAPFISVIHSVDSLKLLVEINKQAERSNRVIDCLLQIFIADEETKFGLSEAELNTLLESAGLSQMKNVRICGLMGMATNTTDEIKIAAEFSRLQTLLQATKEKYMKNRSEFRELSMGMSADYKIALQHGATLIRIGSMLFGKR